MSGKGGPERSCFGKEDPRRAVHEVYKWKLKQLSEEEKGFSLWKNYFLVEVTTKEPGISVSHGTAFLTNLIRTHDGEEYIVLLTAAHNLHDSDCSQGGLRPEIKLYRALDLAEEEYFPNVQICMAIDMEKSFNRRNGWYVFPDSYPDQKMTSDYGAIFVKKKLMESLMNGYGGLINSLIVSPREAPNPAEITKACVAGFPEKYGGKNSEENTKNHVLVFAEDGRLPEGDRAKNHSLSGVTLHDAITSKGQSGCPYVVSSQSRHYAVGIHFWGEEKATYSEAFGAGNVPQWLEQDEERQCINFYKDIDNSLVDWVKMCHVPQDVMDVGSGHTPSNTSEVSADRSTSSHHTPGANEEDESVAPVSTTSTSTAFTTRQAIHSPPYGQGSQRGAATFKSEGIRLRSGDVILLDISEYFTDSSQSLTLAVYLLEGTRPGGGQAFLNNLAAPGCFLSSTTSAFKVLCEWCRVKPKEAFGRRLLDVLQKPTVCPAAAEEFAGQLVPEF